MTPPKVLAHKHTAVFLLAFMLAVGLKLKAAAVDHQQFLDSIEVSIEALSGKDRIAKYLESWELVQSKDKRRALQWNGRSMELADQIGDYESLAKLSWQAGLTYQTIGVYDSARYFIVQSIRIAASRDLPETEIMARYRLGSLLYRIGQSDSAKTVFLDVMDDSKRLNYAMGKMLAHGGLGKMAKREGEFDKALNHFISEEYLADSMNLPNSATHAMLNIGIIYGKMRDYPMAKSVNLKAMNIAEYYGYKDRQFQLNNNLAVLYRLMGLYDSSFYFQRRGLQMAKERKSVIDMTRAYMNFGTTHAYMKDFIQAKMYFDTAYNTLGSSDNIPLKMSVLQNLSAVSKDLGEFQRAIHYAHESLELAKQTKQIHNFRNLYETLYTSWKKLGNADSALVYHELFFMYHDSLFNERKQKNIDEIKIKYESQKLASEYLILENENLEHTIALAEKKLQLNIVMGAGFTIVVIVILLLILFRTRYQKNIIIRQQEIERLIRERKYLSAQALIEGQEAERKRISQELHDGLGVLLSTASLHLSYIPDTGSDQEKEEMYAKADEMLRRAGVESRRIAQNMMPGVLSNFGVFEAIEDLLEDVGDTADIKIQYTHQGSRGRIGERIEIVIYRIVQELVNNTLKYADAKSITLHIHRQSENLLISYSDDGIGFDLSKVENGKSLGLSGIRSRVDLLNGSLEIQSSPGLGFSCHFEIPI